MMHGYAALMRDYSIDLAKSGPEKTDRLWREKLKMLHPGKRYTFGRWAGDLFDSQNPLWREVGIEKPGRRGLTVVNTGAARGEAGRVLRQLVAASTSTRKLE